MTETMTAEAWQKAPRPLNFARVRLSTDEAHYARDVFDEARQKLIADMEQLRASGVTLHDEHVEEAREHVGALSQIITDIDQGLLKPQASQTGQYNFVKAAIFRRDITYIRDLLEDVQEDELAALVELRAEFEENAPEIEEIRQHLIYLAQILKNVARAMIDLVGEPRE